MPHSQGLQEGGVKGTSYLGLEGWKCTCSGFQ